MNQSGNPDQISKVEPETALSAREIVHSDCCRERSNLACEVCGSKDSLENSQKRIAEIQRTLDNMQPPLPEGAAVHLLQYENTKREIDPSFDITRLPSKRLVRIIERKTTLKIEMSKNKDKKALAQETEKSEDAYQTRIATLQSSGISNSQIIQILAADQVTPESERTELQHFSEIISLASTPQDQQLIAEKVNWLNISKLPDPVSFIQHQVFDTPDHQSGFSESFQHSVAEKFNIPRMRNATVADMENNLDAKVPVIVSETGKVTGYKPAITRENAPEIRSGIIMYVNERGHKTYEDLYSGETFPFHGGVTGRELDKMRLQFLSSRPELLNNGVENFFGFSLKNARMPKEHELHRIHEIQNALLGGNRNLSADVMYAGEQKQFSQRLLLLSQFGDIAPFSHSSEQMHQSRNQMGLTNSADPLDVNLEALAIAGDWLNAHPNVSGKAAYDELQAHLQMTLPDQTNTKH